MAEDYLPCILRFLTYYEFIGKFTERSNGWAYAEDILEN